jgi:hypothetical protein
MKKTFAFLAALMSGGYLVTLGIFPDPLPFIDEATALVILVKSLGVLGVDISRYVPFIGKGVRARKEGRKSEPIDI